MILRRSYSGGVNSSESPQGVPGHSCTSRIYDQVSEVGCNLISSMECIVCSHKLDSSPGARHASNHLEIHRARTAIGVRGRNNDVQLL
jgi:uncharacterized Fe-S cluster-containing MiaB family protein